MRKDQRRRIHFYRLTDNFSRMYLDMAERARKKCAVFNHAMLSIKKDHQKDLSFLLRELALQKLTRHFGTQ
ncbi:hypothetical protein D3C73_1370410 [compost metagenome]